ncbi:MAG: hypothetical protein AB1813_24610 [Verrucomicrobiota bacterium]
MRRQNEVTTTLWPWSCVWVNPVRWEFAKALSRAFALATALQNERTLRLSRFGVRRQNEVATALWPCQCVWVKPVRWELAKAVSRALALATALQNERTLRPSRFGVRRQNEVATALWPWQCAWVNPERWELAKAVSRAIALATALHNVRTA